VTEKNDRVKPGNEMGGPRVETQNTRGGGMRQLQNALKSWEMPPQGGVLDKK